MTLPELSAAADAAMVAALELVGKNVPYAELEAAMQLNATLHDQFAAALVNAYRSGQLVERDGVDLVGANTLPTEYVRWLSSIEIDVRVHDLTADEVARLVAAVSLEMVADAVEALEPFANFAANFVDDDGWNGAGLSVHKERISYWFGPSEFRKARAALTAIKGGGDADG